MRRRLVLAAVALMAMVVAAFLIPLGLLVRQVARDRALTAAERDAGALVPVLTVSTDTELLRSALLRTASGRDGRLGVLLPDGTTVGAPPRDAENVELARTRKLAFSSAVPGGVEILTPVVLSGDSAAVIRVFVPTDELRAGVTQSWIALGGVGLLLIGIGVAVAAALARSIVQPVHQLSAAAARLAGGDLGARALPGGPPEIAQAGSAFNLLAGRIVELLAAERELVADLSHRLRTPLTALRLDAEAIESSPQRERVLEDIDGVERAVSELIDEARHPIRADLPTSSDLADVVRERAGFWSVLAEDQGRPWEVSIGDGVPVVRVARPDLEAAIDALLGNVFAHTPEGSGVRVVVETLPAGEARLAVEDRGPGFPAGEMLARGASGGGSTGLGLDIVRRTVSGAGGRMAVTGREGGGSRVELVFPVAAS